MKLKILSLWQPHATLCILPSTYNPALPAKPIETRGYNTNHRGWLGIHSAMRKDPAYKYLASQKPFTDYINRFEKLPFGYILGMVYVGNCFETDGIACKEFCLKITGEKIDHLNEILAFGDFSEGRYGFAHTDFVAFTTPIRASGSQGYWYHDMPNHIGERVKVAGNNGYGIILDYNEDRKDTAPKYYLIKSDNDNKKRWITDALFTIVRKEVTAGIS